MKQSTLYILWAGMFVLCAGLGFIPDPSVSGRVLMTLFSVGFFLPPALLLYRADKEKDRHTLQLIRNLAALSLLLTAVLLVANFLTVLRSEWLGNLVHAVLVIVSSPMICSGYWALSLFLWACLLTVALKLLKK